MNLYSPTQQHNDESVKGIAYFHISLLYRWVIDHRLRILPILLKVVFVWRDSVMRFQFFNHLSLRALNTRHCFGVSAHRFRTRDGRFRWVPPAWARPASGWTSGCSAPSSHISKSSNRNRQAVNSGRSSGTIWPIIVERNGLQWFTIGRYPNFIS